MAPRKNRILYWHDANPLVCALVLGLGSLSLLSALSAALVQVSALRALYILPIWIGTRLGGRLAGFILVGFATLSNVWLDLASGSTSISNVSSGLIWFGVFCLVMLLVAQVEESLSKTERMAHQDSLTGLYNRRGLELEGRRVIHRANRNRDTVSVAMLDCDRFKMINDEFGHRAGDEALKFLAHTLRENTRESDVASRLGGDEFVIVFANTTFAEAEQALARIERAFEAGMEERGYSATLSVGLAQISADARDLKTLVARADEAMYLRKERKRTAALAS